jgi:hypothetical protein
MMIDVVATTSMIRWKKMASKRLNAYVQSLGFKVDDVSEDPGCFSLDILTRTWKPSADVADHQIWYDEETDEYLLESIEVKDLTPNKGRIIYGRTNSDELQILNVIGIDEEEAIAFIGLTTEKCPYFDKISSLEELKICMTLDYDYIDHDEHQNANIYVTSWHNVVAVITSNG